MKIEEIMVKMIRLADGNRHDINHFVKVHSFARTIGLMEGLDARTQYILETSAVVHDIACPLCREKYGSLFILIPSCRKQHSQLWQSFCQLRCQAYM